MRKIIFSIASLLFYSLPTLGAEPTHECPNLTSNLIRQNAAQFPHPVQNRGGDIQIDGKTWQVWNAQSYIPISDRPEDFGNTKSFVEVATDPQFSLNVRGPIKTIGGGKTRIVCVYSYALEHSQKNAATVQLAREEVTSLKDQMHKHLKERNQLSHPDIPEELKKDRLS